MGFLPNLASVIAAVGSQLNITYVLLNNDGSPMNIVGKIFEFSIRTDPSQISSVPPLISVNSVSSTSSGTIVVTTSTSTVAVTINAAPMATLTQTQYFYTLWMDQGLSDATAMVSGTLFAQFTSVP